MNESLRGPVGRMIGLTGLTGAITDPINHALKFNHL